MKKKILVHMDYCTGCRSCSAACAAEHADGVPRLELVQVAEDVRMPLICRHCDDPACVAACPTEAMYRDDEGVVLRNNFSCIGCKSCVLACPFGVLTQELDFHIVPKCDLCPDRRARGEDPACVASCTSGALRFVEVEEVSADREVFLIGSRGLGRSPYVRRR